jgi:hypothetical protein
MTPEKELEALIVTKLATALPSGTQAVRKQQITTAATLPRVVVACDVSTDDQALAQVGVFSISAEVTAMFDAITGSDPATTIQQAINAIDSTLLNWPDLADTSVICLGGTFGAGSTTNDEDRLVRTISGTLWARRRVVIPGVPSAPTGNMIVSGAGSVEANGVYSPRGIDSGGTVFYTKTGFESSDSYNSINRDGRWYVSGSDDILYSAIEEGEATPDLVNWEVYADGFDPGLPPAPTVTAEMSPAVPEQII